MIKPEILSPAGNIEKLYAAVRFGADAVYLAGKRYGMRAGAGNFTADELDSAIKYAHNNGVKVYVTLNTMPRDDEYDEKGRPRTMRSASARAGRKPATPPAAMRRPGPE